MNLLYYIISNIMSYMQFSCINSCIFFYLFGICLIQDQLRFAISGNDVAKEYFYIQETTGVITVKKAVINSKETEYKVVLGLFILL